MSNLNLVLLVFIVLIQYGCTCGSEDQCVKEGWVGGEEVILKNDTGPKMVVSETRNSFGDCHLRVTWFNEEKKEFEGRTVRPYALKRLNEWSK